MPSITKAVDPVPSRFSSQVNATELHDDDPVQSGVLYGIHNGTYVIKLHGEVRVSMCATLSRFIDGMFADPNLDGVLIDLTACSLLDSTALGLVAKIAVSMAESYRDKPTILSTNPDVNRVLASMGFDQVFKLLKTNPCYSHPLCEAPYVEENDVDVACDRVLEAHRILVELNEKNQRVFKDVVAALEQEQSERCTDSAF